MIDLEDSGAWEEIGWDDVKNNELPAQLGRAGRKEEVGFMEGRSIWGVRDDEECWRVTGAPPVPVIWVDTDKGKWVNGEWVPLVRCLSFLEISREGTIRGMTCLLRPHR